MKLEQDKVIVYCLLGGLITILVFQSIQIQMQSKRLIEIEDKIVHMKFI